jgi:hypothetical protein
MNVNLIIISKRNAGMEIPVFCPTFYIGRAKECQFCIISKRMDPRHCVILTEGKSLSIEDCGSVMGTVVNDEKIIHRRELKSGDRIALGALVLEVRVDAGIINRECVGDNFNEASILHWLEDGEIFDDEERYWRRAESVSVHFTKNGVTIDNGDPTRKQRTGMNALGGLSGGLFAKDEFDKDAHKLEKPKTRLQKTIKLICDWALACIGFFKSLKTPDVILLGSIIILVFVVLALLFPIVLTWLKAVVLVHKWPFWIWTSIFIVVLCIAIALRSRYE